MCVDRGVYACIHVMCVDRGVYACIHVMCVDRVYMHVFMLCV